MGAMKRVLTLLFLSVAIVVTPVLAQVYVVQKGDTLYSIARRNDVSLDDLLQVNGLADGQTIFIGQQLTIPGSEPEPQVADHGSSTVSYLVQRGDTLYSIARRVNLTVDELLALNELESSYVLKAEDRLLLPAAMDNPLPVETPPDPGPQTPERQYPTSGLARAVEGKIPMYVIESNRGNRVYSVGDGRVIYADSHATMGQVALVQRADGSMLFYGGNESLSVTKGQLVERGSEIGIIGVTPLVNEPLMYYSLWVDGEFQLPEL